MGMGMGRVHGRRAPAWAGVALVLAWSLGGACRAAGGSMEQLAAALLEELAQRRRLDAGRLAFDGDVVVYSPLGESRFTVHVEKDGPSAVVTSQDAPWFVPRQVTLSLGNPAQLLAGFDLAFEGVEEADGTSYVRLVGRHRSPGLGEARFGRVWIDVGRREVARLELGYFWGRVLSHFRYATILGRTVVASQSVQVHPIGLVLHVAYRNFRWPDLGDPEP